ncbi:hypothetical protein EDD36DRAFT_487001 [Exophiala viscosa]|uniref:Uncharacterized protein n=1 Tax=Exophiala viscosa TaxID=2486360 RepID=A0AAN6IEB4_9EURO|nr:hypothetical protein EDD36DRAFT_487001 [Exophiala viscosa]
MVNSGSTIPRLFTKQCPPDRYMHIAYKATIPADLRYRFSQSLPGSKLRASRLVRCGNDDTVTRTHWVGAKLGSKNVLVEKYISESMFAVCADLCRCSHVAFRYCSASSTSSKYAHIPDIEAIFLPAGSTLVWLYKTVVFAARLITLPTITSSFTIEMSSLTLLAVLLGSGIYASALPQPDAPGSETEATAATTAAASLAQECTTISPAAGGNGNWTLYFSGIGLEREDGHGLYSNAGNKEPEYADPAEICTIATQKSECANIAAERGAKQFALSFDVEYGQSLGPWRCQVFDLDDASPELFETVYDDSVYVWAWTLE